MHHSDASQIDDIILRMAHTGRATVQDVNVLIQYIHRLRQPTGSTWYQRTIYVRRDASR